MAADYLIVTKTSRPALGSNLVLIANKLAELSQLVATVKTVKDHQNNAGDFSVMAAQFGMSAADAQAAAGILDNLNTLLNTATDVTGAIRSTQLGEAVSRLAGQ